jgi:hypothetical protein
MKNCIPLLAMIAFFSCSKNMNPLDDPRSDISKETYVTKTKALLAGSTHSRLAPEAETLDFNTTTYYRMFKGMDIYEFYFTKSYNGGKENGGLISLLLSNRKVFHYKVNISLREDGSLTNTYSTLENIILGTISIENGEIIYSDIAPHLPSDNDITTMDRSWWSCTRECVSDAHIACFQDTHCQTLLLVTNGSAGFVVPKGIGAGSFSISVACGVSCLRNRDLDLLPQY